MGSRIKRLATKSTDPELLVYGYSCKLFKDDDVAAHIDQDKHLIPWMGDNSITIDRYDARAVLDDLSQFDKIYDHAMSDMEVELDYERYRDLDSNVEDEEQKSGAEISYSYTTNEAQIDQPFAPSPLLDIPRNMVLPVTEKQNAVIEKTAEFICAQGSQMEIILKIKQAANPLFGFLSHNHQLRAYYDLIVHNMQKGRLKTQPIVSSSSEQVCFEPTNQHSTLAPFLTKVETAPDLRFKPAPNCVYSMLVNNLKGKSTSDQTEINANVRTENNNKNTMHEFSAYKQVNELPVVTPALVNKPSESCPYSSLVNNLLGKSTIDSSVAEHEMNKQTEMKGNFRKKDNQSNDPPAETKIVIDKVAAYVAKNGPDFENTIREKLDFLNPNNVYFSYYVERVTHYTTRKYDNEGQIKKIKRSEVSPISFSIAPKKADQEVRCFPWDTTSGECEKSAKNELNDWKPKAVEPRGMKSKTEERSMKLNFEIPESSQPFDMPRVSVDDVSLETESSSPVKNAPNYKELQLKRRKRAAEFLAKQKLKSILAINTPEMSPAMAVLGERRESIEEVQDDLECIPIVEFDHPSTRLRNEWPKLGSPDLNNVENMKEKERGSSSSSTSSTSKHIKNRRKNKKKKSHRSHGKKRKRIRLDTD